MYSQGESVAGNVQATSQEDGDYRTMKDLLEEIHAKDLCIKQQSEEIESLKSQLQVVMNWLMPFTQSVSSPVSTSTVTTTTWTRPVVTEPQVVFTSGTLPPLTQTLGNVTKPVLGDVQGINIPREPSVPPGFVPLTNIKSSKSTFIPDLIQLDDSPDLETSSSASVSSAEPDSYSHRNVGPIIKMLEKKSCPKPESYSLESGRSFSRFLQSFEAFCESRYSSSHKDLWTSELGRFLEGEIKQVYDACGGPEKKYRKMKAHLETWHAGAKERISSSRRSQYRSATKMPDEGLLIFATRLEHLYKMAYPHQELDGKDLKRQLLSAIPAPSAETLERDLALVRATTGRQNTWGDVLRLLEIQDETVRRGSWSHQATPPVSSQPWTGAVKKQQNMRVDTVQYTKGRRPAVASQSRKPPQTRSREFYRSPKSPRRGSRSPGQRRCHWCKRLGHIYDNCRRRLNQCLRCGSDSHRIADCPSPIPLSGDTSRGNDRASSASGSERERNRNRSRTQQRRQQQGAYGRQPKSSSMERKTRSPSSSEERALNRDSLV